MKSQGIEFRPFLRKFVVQKCITGVPEEHDGRVYHMVDGVAVTDARADHQHWCEILDVSDDCQVLSKNAIGWFVYLPEFKPNHMYPIPGSEDEWVVRESIFEFQEVPAMIVKEV